MSAHMNFFIFVDNTLLKMSLAVIRPPVGVVTSPEKLIKYSHTVSWVQCVSDFCGRILATILP